MWSGWAIQRDGNDRILRKRSSVRVILRSHSSVHGQVKLFKEMEMKTITFDASAAAEILDMLKIKNILPEEFGGVVNGKAFRNDLCSLIEMYDEMKK